MKKSLLAIIALALFALTACNSYTVPVDLTPEDRAMYEKAVEDYTAKIKNYDPNNLTAEEQAAEDAIQKPTIDVASVNPDGTLDTSVDGVEVELIKEVDKRPPFQYFLELALAQERLGHLGDAIKTYKKALKLYETSEAAWNNLGRIYEQLKQYDKAVTYYFKIIDQFGQSSYYLDIANAYIRKGDADAAQKVYNEYRLKTNKADIAVERYIQSLRQNKTK